ncbi:hypothetical protein LTR78_007905 [Recurvomyces mirabilis]|uniref:DUF3824 domain-containing protein n=1 Tax=Recurvomyces mirabilis TaxID=574656 RepID=A0AAE0WH61_9PEZI|nr:hypothetical protein LTR78_007905 [Recurvomyces mirabilis]KAK5152440.1 hypothetical protein LTS14_008387 [Recurvomyces mirabilis]
MSRIVRREWEVDREDSRTVYEDQAPRRVRTTVKRYQVPDSNNSRPLYQEEDVTDKQITIRRERREPSPPREEIRYKVVERWSQPREDVDIRIRERATERDAAPAPRRDIAYRVVQRDDFDRSSHSGRSDFREVRSVRAPSPPERERVQEFRFERERSFSRSPPRRREQAYDVEKYTKNTEYYSQPQPIIIRTEAPQPIVIREERREPPIVIERERAPQRESQFEFIERSEIREDRDESKSLVSTKKDDFREETKSVARSVAPTAPIVQTPQEEDDHYFYERRVIERDRAPRQRDESHDDRRSEIRPRDSASQYSDDSYEYVRRETRYEDSRSRSRERSKSPHHRRHLAEGAIAGIGAAEIFRHHKRSQGEDVGGRGKSALAGAAVGALGAEAVSRVRSYSRRRKSRSRSRSESYDRDDRRDDRRSRGKRRSRSREKSLSRAQQIGGVAAVAAIGALAGYALKKKGQNKETIVVKEDHPRRSRSRRRRASADSYMSDDRTILSDGGGRALDPEHRNRRIAQAGLASAAAAGLWERVRSKSRGGKDRSKSRVRQSIPIVATGLGGAALAGLYEKNKASKEAKKAAIIDEEIGGRGRRARSRSRSRSVPAPHYADDKHVDDRRGMIAYGDEPIYPDERRGYYSDEEPASYNRRHRGGSDSGSSPDTRRRSRSRGRHLAEGGAAAGAGAFAAHQIGKSRERSRSHAEADRRRHEDERYDHGRDGDSMYSADPHPGGYLPQEQSAYQPQAYPGGTYFPPPPTGAEAPVAAEHGGYPAYNPAEYAQGQHQQPYQNYGYGESSATLGAPYPNDTFAGDARYAPPTPDMHNPHDERNRGRTAGENVSAPITTATEHDPRDADGVNTPRPPRSRSQSRVRFNLDANELHSPETTRRSDERTTTTDSETKGERRHRRRQRPEGGGERDGDEGRRGPSNLMHDQYDRLPESDSESTIDLPKRFDEQGNRKSNGDPFADGLNKFLGNAGLGELLGRLTGGGQDTDEGRSGRRRHRH